MKTKPKIVCLCGSTRFEKEFIQANRYYTLQGWIVLSVGVFVHNSDIQISPKQKAELDELHKRKIDLCDLVCVINVDGYIGESTKSEIVYAKKKGKQVVYLFPPGGPI